MATPRFNSILAELGLFEFSLQRALRKRRSQKANLFFFHELKSLADTPYYNMSHTPNQEQQQSAVKKRLVDRVCPPEVQEIVPEVQVYQETLSFERRLDFNISKKVLDIQESTKRPTRAKKTLRIFLTNLFYTNQLDGAPSWELRLEGRITDDIRPSRRKFSSFFKTLVMELDSDIYPDNYLIEWHRTATTSETDGFQVRRHGDLSVNCKILLQLEHQPPQFKIDSRLARLIGKKADTRPAIINALWQYIKTKSLQDPNDREFINNNSPLSQIFGCKRMRFSDIPAKLHRLLTPPDPVIINHTIVRGIGVTQRSIYEIDVEVEDNVKDPMAASMMSSESIQELQQLDEKICDTLEAIKVTRNTYDLFTSFAEDPHQFTNKWLASHSSDLNHKLGTNDQQANGDSEEERRAEYYYQPWLQEAVCRYFYRKVQERRGDLEVL